MKYQSPSNERWGAQHSSDDGESPVMKLRTIFDQCTDLADNFYRIFRRSNVLLYDSYRYLWQNWYKIWRIQEHPFSPYYLGAATPEVEMGLIGHLKLWVLYQYIYITKFFQRRITYLCQWIMRCYFHMRWPNAIFPLPPYPGTLTLSRNWLEYTLKRNGLMCNWASISQVIEEELNEEVEGIPKDDRLTVTRLHIKYGESDASRECTTLILRSSKKTRLDEAVIHDYIGDSFYTETMFQHDILKRKLDGPVFISDQFKLGDGYSNAIVWSFCWPWGDGATLTQDPVKSKNITLFSQMKFNDALKATMVTLARLHSTCWNDLSITDRCSWLTDKDLYDCKGILRWESLIAHYRRSWSCSQKYRRSLKDKNGEPLIPDLIEDFIDDSLSMSSWEKVSASLANSPASLCHKQIKRSNITFSKLEEDDTSYRARLDDWRLLGIGRPSRDIADAILTCDLNDLEEYLNSDNLIADHYLISLRKELGSIKLTTLNNYEFNKTKLIKDVLNSGMERLVIQIIKKAEEENREKLLELINAAWIWNSYMRVGYVLLT